MNGDPEPRHPTHAGAASTGPPVPTGATTAVVAVHTWSRWGSGEGSLPQDFALARYIVCVTVELISGFSVHEQNRKNVLGANSHQVHFHRVRTTCGDILARYGSGIKLNKGLIRIFFLDMCFFLSFK